MKMHILPVILSLLVMCQVPSIAQLPIIPAKTVEETRFPIFENNTPTRELANFRLHLDYQATAAAELLFSPNFTLPLPAGTHRLELTCQQTGTSAMRISSWIDNKSLFSNRSIAGETG